METKMINKDTQYEVAFAIRDEIAKTINEFDGKTSGTFKRSKSRHKASIILTRSNVYEVVRKTLGTDAGAIIVGEEQKWNMPIGHYTRTMLLKNIDSAYSYFADEKHIVKF